MTVDLSGYRAIQQANYVKLAIPGYSTLYFSDDTQSRTIAGNTYTNIGQLLYISDKTTELRALEQEITVGISGIPAGSIAEFLTYDPKGSDIEIRQALFDPTANTLLNIAGNPLLKFKGIVVNFSTEETWDNDSKTQTFTIVLQATSLMSSITKRVSGRRTNDTDQQQLYPGDIAMSRVVTITNAQFQFGKPGAPSV